MHQILLTVAVYWFAICCGLPDCFLFAVRNISGVSRLVKLCVCVCGVGSACKRIRSPRVDVARPHASALISITATPQLIGPRSRTNVRPTMLTNNVIGQRRGCCNLNPGAGRFTNTMSSLSAALLTNPSVYRHTGRYRRLHHRKLPPSLEECGVSLGLLHTTASQSNTAYQLLCGYYPRESFASWGLCNHRRTFVCPAVEIFWEGS